MQVLLVYAGKAWDLYNEFKNSDMDTDHLITWINKLKNLRKIEYMYKIK